MNIKMLNGYEVNEIQLFGGNPNDVADVVLVRRRQLDGKSLWTVMEKGCCLNKGGEWEFEPIPSERNDEFLQRCRFSTPDEAITAWKRLEEPTRFWHYYG